MARNVLVFDRSSLARNVYLIILSALDEINIIEGDLRENCERFKDAALTTDLIIISHSTLGEKRGECFKMLSGISKEKDISAVLFVAAGSKKMWEDYERIGGVSIMERPFFPNDLLEVVGAMWGSK